MSGPCPFRSVWGLITPDPFLADPVVSLVLDWLSLVVLPRSLFEVLACFIKYFQRRHLGPVWSKALISLSYTFGSRVSDLHSS